MKLTILGGGGVRAPLLVSSILNHARQFHLDELCLMDINQAKLELIGSLCTQIAKNTHPGIQLTTTTDPRSALQDAAYVITTVRVGDEAGRILDEKIAMRHGVLGQETTGAGGFAMALRSIPVILEYARMLEDLSPGAWIINFTNPAGLVTQALRDAGFKRVIGICDSANNAQKAVAKWHNLSTANLRAEVFGLNHLSWCRKVIHNGQDLLQPLLQDPCYLSRTLLRVFDPDLVRQIGMHLNEYLYYYYYREKAIAHINGNRTRGEDISHWNQELLARINEVDARSNQDQALEIYYTYNDQRVSTYMQYQVFDDCHDLTIDPSTAQNPIEFDQDGYAGVALNVILAMESGQTAYTALNVPNQDSIQCMCPSDVVEVSCRVDQDGIHTLPIGEIPEHQELLMRSVKLYERLTVAAVQQKSRCLAIEALMSHPLVSSYSLAKALVADYIEAHAPYIGDWN